MPMSSIWEGVQVGVKYNALSVDHLENVGDEEIECLLQSETMPTILLGLPFFEYASCSCPRKNDRRRLRRICQRL